MVDSPAAQFPACISPPDPAPSVLKPASDSGTTINENQSKPEPMMKRLSLFVVVISKVWLSLFMVGCGQPNGQGTSEARVEGKSVEKFVNEKPISPGTYTWSDGAKYVGEFNYGMPNGQGTETFPDGSQYVGEFKNSHFDGQGSYTKPDGVDVRGEWRDNKPYKTSGTSICPDGTKEVGTWNHDGTNCGGTITWTDGRQYRGDWKVVDGGTDLPDGTGKMTYPGGKVEEGLWKDGKFVGASKSP